MNSMLALSMILAANPPTGVPATEECYQTSSGEQCDIILRHTASPIRSTRTTDYECREGFRFRLIYEEVSTHRGQGFFQISATTLRSERFATVSATDLERITTRFDGANVADVRLVSCGLHEGTAEILVSYFHIDWPQLRTVRYVVSADGQVDDGVEQQVLSN